MQKRIEKTIDMTEGRLFTKILGFAIPVCLGLLFQQLYNLADTSFLHTYCAENV